MLQKFITKGKDSDMKKKILFLLLFISTSLCAMNEERKKKLIHEWHKIISDNLSAFYTECDRHTIMLHNLIEKAQFKWGVICDHTDPFVLRDRQTIEVLSEGHFTLLEKILKKEGTEIAEKQLVVLKQLKSDQDKLNGLPVIPFEETLKKYEELIKGYD